MARINKDDQPTKGSAQASEKTLSKQEQDERAALKAELRAEVEAELRAEQEAKAKGAAEDRFAGYEAPENEKDLYHVSLEKVLFNNKTGQKVSKPYVQKFTVSEYKDLLVHGAGFTIVVLHDPTKVEEEEDLA